MLISALGQIRSLKMTKVTSRSMVAEAIVVIGGVVIVRLPKGRWWCSLQQFDKYILTPRRWNSRIQDVLEGLCRLGLIERPILEEYKKLQHQDFVAYQHGNDVRELAEIAKRYNVTMPTLPKPVTA